MKIITNILTILLFCFVFSVVSNAQTDNSNKAQEKDRPLKIKSKPLPSSIKCRELSGVARVRATFDKSGKVTEVELVIASPCENYNANVIEAAKKIKFKPAIKNGEPITVTKLLEYSFWN